MGLNKLYLIIVVLLLIGSVSAYDFDNKLVYSNNDMKVTFENTFLGIPFLPIGAFGTATLASHKNVNEIINVGVGANKTVMYYDFNFTDVYPNGLDSVIFTDMETGKQINLAYHYAYLGNVVVNDYKDDCSNVKDIIYDSCKRSIIGNHTELQWISMKSLDIPKGIERIALVVDYMPKNKKIDAKWIVAGKEISKHAGFSSWMQDNLVGCWTLDETSGTTVIDYSLGQRHNGTNNGAGINQAFPGMPNMGTAYLIDGNANHNVSFVPTSALNITGDLSFGIVMKDTQTDAGDFGGKVNGYGYPIGVAGNKFFSKFVVSGAGDVVSSSSNVNDGSPFFGVFTHSNGNTSAYVNGTLETTTATTAGSLTPNPTFTFGGSSVLGQFSGYVAEVWLANFTMNSTDISEIWNGSNVLSCKGLAAAPVTEPNITIYNPYDGQNFSTTTVVFGTISTDPDNATGLNVTVYTNVTGSWLAAGINASAYNNTWTNFTSVISDGTYKFGAVVKDYLNTTWSANNYTFVIDSTGPVIGINKTNYTYQQVLQGATRFNYTANDTHRQSCWYNYNGTNVSLSDCNDNFTLINLTLADTDVYFYSNDTFGNLGSDYWNWSVTPSVLVFNVLDYNGDMVVSPSFTGNITYVGNPYNSLMSSWLNDTDKNINITVNVTDLGLYNRNTTFTFNINASQLIYNLSMNPNELVIAFYNSSGSLNNTMFELFDGNKTIANDTSSIVIVSSNLSNGKIQIKFNEPVYGDNWTQFYEYINNHYAHVTENITLIDNPDWFIYFEVLSKDNRVIENAVLRAEAVVPEGNVWKPVKLIGQRLSDPDGKTFFVFNSSSFVKITVTADGYAPYEKNLIIGDELAASKSASYPIYLTESTNGVASNVYVTYPKQYLNRSDDIPGLIMAKSADTVKINTNYRVGLGLTTPRQLSLANNLYGGYTGYNTGVYDGKLTRGVDFANTGTDDIVVYIYIDNVNEYNWTISNLVPTRVLDIGTVDEDVLIIAAAIGLIIIAGALGAIIGETVGFTTFMIGGMFLTLLNLKFLWLTIVVIMYFTIKIINKITKE